MRNEVPNVFCSRLKIKTNISKDKTNRDQVNEDERSESSFTAISWKERKILKRKKASNERSQWSESSSNWVCHLIDSQIPSEHVTTLSIINQTPTNSVIFYQQKSDNWVCTINSNTSLSTSSHLIEKAYQKIFNTIKYQQHLSTKIFSTNKLT